MDFNVEPTLTSRHGSDLNSLKANTNYTFAYSQTPQNVRASGISIHIENFVNNRSQDVQAFVQELKFYSRRSSLALG